MPLPAPPRFVAPHFMEIDGSADMPGPLQRACAFTTVMPGWPRNGDGATHHHRCTLTSHTGRWQETGPVSWQTESWPIAVDEPASLLPPEGEAIVSQGHAPDLMQAIASALGAAYTPRPAAGQHEGIVQCVAPAFVAMRREAGLPRIWVCSHLNAQGHVATAQPWTHLQTIFVREWPGSGKPGRFQCELETLPFSAVLPAQSKTGQPTRPVMRWWAPDLETALRSALEQLYGTSQTGRRLDLGLRE